MVLELRTAAMLAAVLVFAGCSTPTANMNPTPQSNAAAARDPACLTSTGSRIPVAGNRTDCVGYGRSYTNADMQRTGATTVADALRLMDSSVTIQH
jgi:hypothetical protein